MMNALRYMNSSFSLNPELADCSSAVDFPLTLSLEELMHSPSVTVSWDGGRGSAVTQKVAFGADEPVTDVSDDWLRRVEVSMFE